MSLKYLIKKELLQMRRNSFLPRLMFIFPIMVMCVMPWVMTMEVTDIRIVTVDNDRSTLSERLISRIGSSELFRDCGLRPSYSEALDDVERGHADVILEIPRGYADGIEGGGQPERALIAANAVNGTKGAMGAQYLQAIIAHNAAAGTAPRAAAPQAADTLFLYNKHLDYRVFMIPALMSVLMILLCGFLPALNIVGEKETGTIEQINVTPVGKAEFIVAKLIPYWTLGLVVLTICFALSWLVYGIVPAGSLPLLYLLSALLAVTVSGFGLVVSGGSGTMQQAMFVMWFFVVCMMLLSGLFTPVRSMPEWAQTLTLINPVRHYIDAMRTVFVRGGGAADVMPQLAALSVFATTMTAWAVIGYRKTAR